MLMLNNFHVRTRDQLAILSISCMGHAGYTGVFADLNARRRIVLGIKVRVSISDICGRHEESTESQGNKSSIRSNERALEGLRAVKGKFSHHRRPAR